MTNEVPSNRSLPSYGRARHALKRCPRLKLVELVVSTGSYYAGWHDTIVHHPQDVAASSEMFMFMCVCAHVAGPSHSIKIIFAELGACISTKAKARFTQHCQHLQQACTHTYKAHKYTIHDDDPSSPQVSCTDSVQFQRPVSATISEERITKPHSKVSAFPTGGTFAARKQGKN